MKIRIRRGCNIPISGSLSDPKAIRKETKEVAVYGPDFVGMKPSMLVKVGDRVVGGQPIFRCKKTEGVIYTAPTSGIVKTINRGARRFFQSIVIERDGKNEQIQFETFGKSVKELLLESGEWSSLRVRPYSKVADPSQTPSSIFITAVDTNPLAPSPGIVIDVCRDDFERGLGALKELAPVNLCLADNYNFDTTSAQTHYFSGKHPAGNVGTHIHFVDPVYEGKQVWHIGYQNVIAIGKLLNTGKIWSERYVALVGPLVKEPKLLLTNRGANLEELIGEEIVSQNCRIISGSVLCGHHAFGPTAYLGRYHNQVTIIDDSGEREFLGWAMPGARKFSLSNSFLSTFIGTKKFIMNTLANGGHRAIVPLGTFEKVVPLDILATPLLKALASNDVDQAQRLGALELDEEDLALCTFACNGKNDYGVMLRNCLTTIEKEG